MQAPQWSIISPLQCQRPWSSSLQYLKNLSGREVLRKTLFLYTAYQFRLWQGEITVVSKQEKGQHFQHCLRPPYEDIPPPPIWKQSTSITSFVTTFYTFQGISLLLRKKDHLLIFCKLYLSFCKGKLLADFGEVTFLYKKSTKVNMPLL